MAIQPFTYDRIKTNAWVNGGSLATPHGIGHAWAAILLKRRRPLGRILSLGLALVNLLVLPFGTAFGAYALWVLLTHEGRHLFEPAAAR